MGKHIHEYCVGRPRSIISSHSGSVDIAVSFQERSVFLPATGAREGEEWSEEVDNGRAQPAGGSNGASGDRSASGARASGQQGTHNTESGELPSYEGEQEAMGSVLRGSVIVKLQKATKIRCLSLDLYGISRTYWNLVPQPGVLGDTPLPSNSEIEDITYFGYHHWDFIHTDQFPQAKSSYGKQNDGDNATLVSTDCYGASAMTSRESGNVQEAVKTHEHRSQRDKVPILSPLATPVRKLKQITPNTEGITYPAGEYVYHFSIIIHRDCPETITVPNGSIKYVLVPKVVRAGAFNPNISGQTNIEVVRAPLTSSGMLVYNPASLSRIWDNRLEYSISLPQRYITLDAPSSLTLSLMCLPDSNVMVHQVRIYLLESVKYLYSPDSTIHSADSSLKLVLFQKNADIVSFGEARAVGSLLSSSEPLHLDCSLLVSSHSDRSMKEMQQLPQIFGRGKLGEKRFVVPDHTSPFITVRHRLIITLRVSKLIESDSDKRHHFEIKVDTPITMLSKDCVQENIYLPQYNDTAVAPPSPPQDDIEAYDDGGLPTFHESQDHKLLSSAARRASQPRPFEDTKFSVSSSQTPDARDAVNGQYFDVEFDTAEDDDQSEERSPS